MAKFNLSPYRIARFYFHECERHLRYASTPRDRLLEEGVPEVPLDRSIVTRELLEGGFLWEEMILKDLGPRAIIAPGDEDSPLHERRHSIEDTNKHLTKLEVGQVLYQPTLRPPPDFYTAYGLDPELVRFVDCHPDMVMATDDGIGGIELRVVDAKASDMMKLSHRIQVGLYSLILEHVISGEGIAAGPSRSGGVWLFEQPEVEWFDLSRVRPPLETFLTHELTPILNAPASEAFWHLYFRCEWCDYYTHCREEADSSRDVSLVPYLSTFAKRHLKVAGVRSVEDFGDLLASDNADEKLAGCASLEGRRERLTRTVHALVEGKTSPTGNVSVAMPKGEQVRLVLSLQSEPLTGSLYGYAINRVFGKDLFPEWRETIVRVAEDSQPPTLVELKRNLVRDLMTILRVVHDHNAAHGDDWGSQKGVQTYVFDGYEREILVDTLLEATADPDVQEEALSLLFHFQHPDLALADDHPADEVFFPLIVLTNIVRQLFAMPVPIVYRFADVAAELQPSEYGFSYSHSDYFGFELSNRMRSDPIMTVWNKGRTDLIRNIENELKARVWAASSVIDGIREKLEGVGSLFAWPPKFFLPPGLGFSNPVLSRLAFIAKYEAVLGYLDARARRTAAETERVKMRDAARLRFVGDDRYVADPSDQPLDIDAGGFPNWVLTTDTDDGHRARNTFDDFAYKSKMYAPKQKDMALASVTGISEAGEFHITLSKTQAFTPPAPGDICFLDGRFTDWLSDRLVTDLDALDNAPDPWFVRLIEDPVGTRASPSIVDEIRDVAVELARAHGMTPSQLDAFTGTVESDVQLVWGPPGTGKTHFLALAILCLAEAHRRAGRQLRVLISAFTHSAINNCLAKLDELRHSTGLYGGDLPVRKATREDDSPVLTVAPDAIAAVISGEDINVTGSTVWQLHKTDPSDLAFDLVLIDEGSQLKVGEAAIAIRRMRAGGRLVIAGDDKQLAPIVQGRYPSGDGQPLLHRSILECLRDRDEEDALTVALLENFRMCDVLCEYPRTSIYPEDYRPFSAEVAARRLPDGPSSGSELVDLLLDPEYPLVVCILEGVKATAENRIEAQLVADSARALYERLGKPKSEEFWADRLFVVSPHHAQIRRIRRELARKKTWKSPPFVDTVDKMQGQECDAVMVSYGVSDVEYALSEKEFIYSLNRLNVSITRARMKTIVFLSKHLLEPPIQALDQDDVADGIAFMQGAARFCEIQAPPIRIGLGEGIVAAVARAR